MDGRTDRQMDGRTDRRYHTQNPGYLAYTRMTISYTQFILVLSTFLVVDPLQAYEEVLSRSYSKDTAKVVTLNLEYTLWGKTISVLRLM